MTIEQFIKLTQYVATDNGVHVTYQPTDPVPNIAIHFTDIIPGKTHSHVYTCEEIADFFENGRDAQYIVLRAHFLAESGICERCDGYDQDGYMRECMEVWTCESCFDDIITANDMDTTYNSMKGTI